MASKRSGEHLAALHFAHSRYVRAYTPREEDYLEMIYELVDQKGYARTADISVHMHVQPPSVTRMIQKLHTDGFLVYEKYRGIKLTDKGEKLAKSVRQRHETFAMFLKLLGVDDRTAQEDSEGIEHHVHPKTLERLTKFVLFVRDNPTWFKHLEDYLRATANTN